MRRSKLDSLRALAAPGSGATPAERANAQRRVDALQARPTVAARRVRSYYRFGHSDGTYVAVRVSEVVA